MTDRSGLIQIFTELEGMGGKSHHGDFALGDADFLETSIGMLLTVGAIFFHSKGSLLSLSEQLHQIPFPHYQ